MCILLVCYFGYHKEEMSHIVCKYNLEQQQVEIYKSNVTCKLQNVSFEIADIANQIVNEAVPQMFPICKYNILQQTLEVHKTNVVVKGTNVALEINDAPSQQQDAVEVKLKEMEEKYEARIAALEDKIRQLEHQKVVLPRRRKYVQQHVAHLKRFVLKRNQEVAENFTTCKKMLEDDITHRYQLFERHLKHDANLLAESIIQNYQDSVAQNDAVQNNLQQLQEQLNRLFDSAAASTQQQQTVVPPASPPQASAQDVKVEEAHPLCAIFTLVQSPKGSFFKWFVAISRYSNTLGRFEEFWQYLFNNLSSDTEAMSYIQNCLYINKSAFRTICNWARSQIGNFQPDAEMQNNCETFCNVIMNYINKNASSSSC